jgi:hypothetical protein
MNAVQAQNVLWFHWPGFMPKVQQDGPLYVVRLVRWPPAKTADVIDPQTSSTESYEAALMDLAKLTTPLIRCKLPDCVVCQLVLQR